MRTTLDIDDLILMDLRRLQRRDGKSLGRLVSDPLALVLGTTQVGGSQSAAPVFKRIAQPMRGSVDLADKHAILDAMDDLGR